MFAICPWGFTLSIFSWESLSLLYTFVINIVVVTVYFLVSLLFPLNCSYLPLISAF